MQYVAVHRPSASPARLPFTQSTLYLTPPKGGGVPALELVNAPVRVLPFGGDLKCWIEHARRAVRVFGSQLLDPAGLLPAHSTNRSTGDAISCGGRADRAASRAAFTLHTGKGRMARSRRKSHAKNAIKT